MTRKLVALVTAVTISLAAAPSVLAMEMEFNMLTGAVYNELKSRGLPTEQIDTLTLAQIAQIRAIVDSGDTSDGNKTQLIKAILEQ